MALMVYRAISSYSGVNICSVVSDWWEIAEISQTSVLITQIWVILAENGNKQWPDFWVLSAFFSPISFDIYRYKISWTDVGPWRVKPVSSHGVILFVCWPARGTFLSVCCLRCCKSRARRVEAANLSSFIDKQSEVQRRKDLTPVLFTDVTSLLVCF